MRISQLIYVCLFLISCDYHKSFSTDVVTGLSSRGDGISCEEVYLSDGKNKISKKSFTYGEEVYFNFEGLSGLTRENDLVYPGMELQVVSSDGDTVMNAADLYAESTEDFSVTPLTLFANIVLATPIHSGDTYRVMIRIWDKKGEGTFSSSMDIEVKPNPHIQIESKGVTYQEIYLFSQERNLSITGNSARYNEHIYLLFEGLEGFNKDNGQIEAGLSIRLTDKNGKLILNEEDLFGTGATPVDDFQSQVAPNIIVTDTEIQSPVTFEVVIWDKKTENQVRANIELMLE